MEHDSFLEEMGLASTTNKPIPVVSHAEKYITSRRSQSPMAKGLQLEGDEFEALIKQCKPTSSPVLASSPILKTLAKKSVEKTISPIMNQSKIYFTSPIETTPKRKIEVKETKLSSSRLKHSEKKIGANEEKLKPVENIKNLELLKTNLLVKKRIKKSPESRESSKLSDGSLKENSRPSDLSEDTSSETAKEEKKNSIENSKKQSKFSDKSESLVMLSAIKDIVSEFTKTESTKIMKMMQDHYINSQLTLIKQLLIATDDIRDSIPGKNNPQVQNLIQENEQLKNNVTFLQNKVEELQRENLALKKKIQIDK